MDGEVSTEFDCTVLCKCSLHPSHLGTFPAISEGEWRSGGGYQHYLPRCMSLLPSPSQMRPVGGRAKGKRAAGHTDGERAREVDF